MTSLPFTATRLFGTPLLIHRSKLDVILSVLGPRIGLPELPQLSGQAHQAERNVPGNEAHPGEGPRTAVIPIHGTLVRRTVGLEAESGLTSYATFAGQIDAAVADTTVQAILLDIDSPGGESAGVFDLADRIRQAAQVKPVWAVANDMAFSAAYALASGASRIFVSRTGGVGSIGVIAMHVDQSARDAQDGVHYTAVFAGDRKNDLSPHAPISTEAQSFLQAEVDRIYGLFVQTVARHRGMSTVAVQATQAGLFFGEAAVAAGLADAVGTFDDALRQLTESVSPPGSSPPSNLLSPSPSSTGARSILQPEPCSMTSPSTHVSNTVPPVAEPVAPIASTSLSAAVEIAQTCTLAGRADLIAGFLESGLDPKAVRNQLLAAQAQGSPEIVSRIDPNAAHHASRAVTNAASPDNPLIQAVKNRLAAAQAFQPIAR